MTSQQEWIQITQAATKIEANLQDDCKFKSIADLLRASTGQPSLSGLQDVDYPTLSHRTPLISQPILVPLPTEVLQEFVNMQQNCALGIFPEMSRAWVSIDSSLFLWSYDNSSEVAYYHRVDQTILAVHLFKPRANVFKSHIKYLLCLITASEITLLGVTLPDLDTVLLIPDPIAKLSTDNVTFNCMSGTDDGRIFLGGNDGCLYEIVYQAEEGWFSRKCRKINHSHSYLSYVKPSFLTLSEQEAISQIEVDNTRQLLYVRTDKSTLHLYDLGGDGSSLRLASSKSLSSLVNQASCIARTIDTSNFKPIVGIKAITNGESPTIHLVAVTQAGVRLYFSACGGERPSSLELVHVRLPPGFTPSSAMQRPASISHTYYRDNLFMFTSCQNESKDLLWVLNNDFFVYEDQMMEAFNVTSLGGKVWCIAEEISRCVSRTTPDLVNPPLVVRQQFEPRRKFILLTSEGVQIYYTQRPIDQLRLLLLDNEPSSPPVKSFFYSTKLAEACVTSLILACSSSLPQELQLAESATLAFYKYGVGNARQDAIHLYLSRILRPIWLLKVTKPEVFENTASMDEITLYLKRLVELNEFLNRKLDDPDRTSLSSLASLLARSIEVLNLYQLLFEHQFNLSPDLQAKIKDMSFKDLIVSGNEVTISISSSLVRLYIDDNQTTDAICRKLHELCPSIFKHENALQAKAHEMINRSRIILDPVEKTRTVQEAVSLLKRIGTRLDLQAACDLLHSARAFKHIVDICLFVAEKRDPLNMAVLHIDGEDQTRATAVSYRKECYSNIIFTLDRLEGQEFMDVFDHCVKSTDELFHSELYQWLCDKNLAFKLLDVKSAYVESFLKKKADIEVHSSTFLDLMWKYYERRGNFTCAARILAKLASKPTQEYGLHERLEYLSRAKGCTEALPSPGDYLHELEEKMEVARIQILILKRLEERQEKNSPLIQEAISELNYGLCDLTQLYQNFGQKFNLYDCQLLILKCGNHHDPSLIEKLWKSIIDEVWTANSEESPDTQLYILSSAIVSLGKKIMPSERFFPIYFIIAYLEYKSHTYSNLRWVPNCLLKIGFKPKHLLEPYHKLYKSREHSVYWPGKSIHVLKVVAQFIEDSLQSNQDTFFATSSLDVICDYLIDLKTMTPDTNTKKLQQDFTMLQSKINQLI